MVSLYQQENGVSVQGHVFSRDTVPDSAQVAWTFMSP